MFFCVVFNSGVEAAPPLKRVITQCAGAASSLKLSSFARMEAARRFPGMFPVKRNLTVPKEQSVLAVAGGKDAYVPAQKQRPDYASGIWRSVFLAEHLRIFGEKNDWKYDTTQHLLASESLRVVIAFIFVGDEYPTPVLKDNEYSFRIFVGDADAILNVHGALIAKKFCSEKDFFFYKISTGSYGAFRGKDSVISRDAYFQSGVFASIFSEMQKTLLEVALSEREMVAEEELS